MRRKRRLALGGGDKLPELLPITEGMPLRRRRTPLVLSDSDSESSSDSEEEDVDTTIIDRRAYRKFLRLTAHAKRLRKMVEDLPDAYEQAAVVTKQAHQWFMVAMGLDKLPLSKTSDETKTKTESTGSDGDYVPDNSVGEDAEPSARKRRQPARPTRRTQPGRKAKHATDPTIAQQTPEEAPAEETPEVTPEDVTSEVPAKDNASEVGSACLHATFLIQLVQY